MIDFQKYAKDFDEMNNNIKSLKKEMVYISNILGDLDIVISDIYDILKEKDTGDKK